MRRIFEGLPMELMVGQHPRTPESIIGFAHGYIDDDGGAHIHIDIDPEASKKLIDLEEMFKLTAIGFAGVRRRPSGG